MTQPLPLEWGADRMSELSTGKREITLEDVAAAIRRVPYGQVLIKVHQGRIVGLEVTEKYQV